MSTALRLLPVAAALAALGGCATPGYQCPSPQACSPVHITYQQAKADSNWSGWAVGQASGKNSAAADTGRSASASVAPSKSEPQSVRDGKSDSLYWGASDGTARKAAAPAKVVTKAHLKPAQLDLTGKPVYVPPQPWRVWLAPWSAKDGTLSSGSYVWFTTPGHWDYLGKTWAANPLVGNGTSGSASGSGGYFHPVDPTDLGFTPGAPAAQQGVIKNMTQPYSGGSK